MKAFKLLTDFFKGEKAVGIMLLICAGISILLTNSPLREAYISFWKVDIAGHPVDLWVNEGLMAIFFLLVGLDLEKEIYVGQLSNIKSAMLPICAAIGGMLVPAGIHLFLNYGTPSQPGAGIPMATDIVFALGVLSLLGKRVPTSLKIFLTAFAVIDDMGAVLTIAIFYSNGISFLNLGIALGIFFVLGGLNRFKVRYITPYLVGGIGMWYFMLQSGVHTAISGVLFAFAVPIGHGDEKSLSHRLRQFLQKPVSFFILPIFALANTIIIIRGSVTDSFFTPNSLGIFFGLFLGKPAGILLFSFLAVTIGICTKPADIKWRHIVGIGLLGGIGFTMSIFITLLAFNKEMIINTSKIVIVLTSVISAIAGTIFLHITLPRKKAPQK